MHIPVLVCVHSDNYNYLTPLRTLSSNAFSNLISPSNAQRTLSERSEAPTVPTLFFKLAFPTNRNIYDAAETH